MKPGDIVRLRWGDTVRGQVGIGVIIRIIPSTPPYSRTSPYQRCDVFFSGTGTVEGIMDTELEVL